MTVTDRILAALRRANAELDRRDFVIRVGGEGNPYHDEHGRFTSPAGGLGDHHAGRRRRRKRQLHEFASHELGGSHAGLGWRKVEMRRRESRPRIWDVKGDELSRKRRRAVIRLDDTYDKHPLWESPDFRSREGEAGRVQVVKNASYHAVKGQKKYYVQERWWAHSQSTGKTEHYDADSRTYDDYDRAVETARKWSARLHNDSTVESTGRALRSGEGNPHHDVAGKFTSAGGEGHAQPPHKPHGKHHARRERRKARRRERAEGVRKEHKADLAELKARHRAERTERVRDERKERSGLKREHAKEVKSLAKEHAKDTASRAKFHAKEKVTHEKRWAKERERIGKAHEVHSTRLARAERHAARMPKRHAREKATLEARIKSGEHAKDVHKITADQAAKAAGKSKAEIEAIEAHGQAVAGKAAEKSRELLAKQHESEHAKVAELPGLRARLEKRTEGRLAKLERKAAALEKHHEGQRRSTRHRQRTERREQAEEHAEARADLAVSHREERQSIREGHREERAELIERYRSELEEHGFRRKGARRDIRGYPGVVRQHLPGFSPVDNDVPGVAEDPAIAPGLRRLAPARTHKASSAESILRHVLRRRGWSAAWRAGELTDRQHLTLLGDVREYARGWLRHEAEVLFASYGRDDVDAGVGRDGILLGGVPGGLAGSLSDRRGLQDGSMDTTANGETVDGVARALGGALAHHVGRFFGRARQFVREAILAGAMVLHGPQRLTADDLIEADRQARDQAQYLERFELDAHLKTPLEIAAEGVEPLQPMTGPQFIARAEMYGDAVHTGAQAVLRAKAVNGGRYVEERRVHGQRVDDMCATCVVAVARGWVPIGSLPPIGDSECVGNCHCYFRYRDAAGKETSTVRPMRGRKARLTRRPVVQV